MAETYRCKNCGYVYVMALLLRRCPICHKEHTFEKIKD